MIMEKFECVFEQLSNSGIFYPKKYFAKGKLFSSQIGSTNQESVLRAFDINRRFTTIMEDIDGNIVVFDGHHSVGYSIYENSQCRYTKRPYDKNIRMTPFSVFYCNFKQLLPREY